MTEAENRMLAEWVGWTFDPETETWHEPECLRWKEGMPCLLDCGDEEDLTDFLSLEGSMMLLEKMLQHHDTTAIAIRPKFGYFDGSVERIVPSCIQGPTLPEAIRYAALGCAKKWKEGL